MYSWHLACKSAPFNPKVVGSSPTGGIEDGWRGEPRGPSVGGVLVHLLTTGRPRSNASRPAAGRSSTRSRLPHRSALIILSAYEDALQGAEIDAEAERSPFVRWLLRFARVP